MFEGCRKRLRELEEEFSLLRSQMRDMEDVQRRHVNSALVRHVERTWLRRRKFRVSFTGFSSTIKLFKEDIEIETTHPYYKDEVAHYISHPSLPAGRLCLSEDLQSFSLTYSMSFKEFSKLQDVLKRNGKFLREWRERLPGFRAFRERLSALSPDYWVAKRNFLLILWAHKRYLPLDIWKYLWKYLKE